MNTEGFVKLHGVFRPTGMRKTAKANFDSAQSGPQMAQRFQHADRLSPNAENNEASRDEIRSRARYEALNSTYCRGISLTVANDTIGTGPRLQFQSSNKSLNSQVQTAFKNWSHMVRLEEKLRTMRVARMVDGEVIGELVTNENLMTPVKLDVALYEADYLVSPDSRSNSKKHYDGIDYDEYGNPTNYWLLNEHPGDVGTFSGFTAKPKAHPATSIIHYFRPDRPGQRRGISEIQSALELFNMLRCYTKAVLDAAETAANHAGILYTQTPPDQEADDVAAFYEESLTRNMMKALPFGWDLRQLRAEQPTTTYPQFKAEIINEIARCLNVPFNVAALNSADYNYASGRLDHQTYFRAIEIEQRNIEHLILSRIFTTWLMEYAAVLGLNRLLGVPYTWHWDGQMHVDPQKEATAQGIRLQNGTTTLAFEYARVGLDWEEELDQREREQEAMEKRGLTFAYVTPDPVVEPVDTEEEDE